MNEVQESMTNQVTLICGSQSWLTCNHWLFQLGNFLILLTFIPIRGYLTQLYVRLTAAGGLFCLAIWAWLVLCLPDAILWNMVFAFIHGCYINRLLWQVSPTQTFDAVGELVYRQVFKPLNVSRLVFSRIYRRAKFSQTDVLKQVLTNKAFEQQDSPAAHLRMVIFGSVNLVINEKKTVRVEAMEVIETPFLFPRHETSMEISIPASTTLLSWKMDDVLGLQYEEDKDAFGLMVAKDIVKKSKKEYSIV